MKIATDRKILVVTPTLGGSPFFGATIMGVSLIAKNGIYRVIGPSDCELVLKSENDFSDLKMDFSYIHEPTTTRGLYAAINYAVANCDNDDWGYLTYINDDDAFGTAFHGALVNHFKTNSEAFGYGRVSLINESGTALSAVPIEKDSKWFEALLAQGISPLNQQGMIIPRALWEKLGGFRTEYKLCADLDFWLRAHRLGWPFKYYPYEVGQFRIREGQLSGDTKKLQAEIAAVVARDAPRKIGGLEKFYARWQFRIKNLTIYINRFISGRRLRGMKLLAGK